MYLRNTPYKILLIVLFNLNSFSQEHPYTEANLNFEDLEGNKARGWEEIGNAEYQMGIDTIIAWSGRNSAFIESKNMTTGFKAWSFSIPANFIGTKIKLTGYVKTKDIDEGFAGLWMRIEPKVAFYNMYDRGITGTTEWQKYEIELEYDSAKSENIVIGGLLAGKGKMWLDKLELTIDGKPLNTAESIGITAENKELLLDQIKQNIIELKFATNEQIDKSLNSLMESIGDKKIVAIGEDTHGTSEYYRLREAITKRLITEKGFNVVVLENPYDDNEKLVEGVQKENLDTLMRRHLFSIYQTKEMKSFLNWYKSVDIVENVQFKGSDDSYWTLPNLLEEQLSSLGDKITKDLVEKLKNAANLTVEDFNTKYSIPDQRASNSNHLGLITYETAIALEEYLGKKGLINKKLEEFFFNLKSTYVNYFNLINKKPIQSRDEIMAQRIRYLAKDPNSKIVVWAHNAHISNIVIIDGEIGLMGNNLKEEFGKNYHSIGMSSLEGNYSYIENQFINDDHSYNDRLLEAEIISSPDTSWEKILGGIGPSAFYFQTNRISEIGTIENLKLLGYGQEKSTDYYKLSLLKMFDTVFFINSTTATKPLFNFHSED